MKTFSQISKELIESKFKLPKGHEFVKRETSKIGGEKVIISFTSSMNGKKFHVYLNDSKLGDFKSLKQAEKEVKDTKGVLGQMESEGINIKEVIDEINIRV